MQLYEVDATIENRFFRLDRQYIAERPKFVKLMMSGQWRLHGIIVNKAKNNE
jgi:hypothetical protein